MDNSFFKIKDQTARRGAERVLLAVFCVFFALIIALGAGASTFLPAMAAKYTAYDRTAIEDDLRGVDISAYPADENGRHFLLDDVGFMEYGYSESAFIVDNYFGIYLYVYNPTEREVSTRAGANVVNMATEYDAEGNPTNYENVPLTVLDHTENHRFYKFRITDSSAIYTRANLYARAHDGVRRYDVAGIQLWFLGENGTEADNAEDESVARTYTCTGYAEGCGPDSDAESNLNIHEERLTVVELDVGQTYWRSDSINQNGANHYNQINSVYFAIPEEAVVKYGELWGVTCRWDERRTSPVIVTNRQDIYDDVKNHLNYQFESDFQGETDSALFEIYDQYQVVSGMGSTRNAAWAYNPSNVFVTNLDPVGWTFKVNNSNILEAQISTDEMLQWASEHGFADYLFVSDVDEGRTYGNQQHTFYADEPFDLLTFNSTANGWDRFVLSWQQFWSFGSKVFDWGEENEKVDPIKRVSDSDFSGTDEVNAEKLFVHDLDYGEFKSYYDAHKNDAVYLLRFAVTDYYAAVQHVWEAESGIFDSADTSSTYMARETVFLDFEIIELTFNKDGNLTVLPAVMSPIDIISGIDPPKYNQFDWTLVWWLVGMMVGSVVVGILGTMAQKMSEKKGG